MKISSVTIVFFLAFFTFFNGCSSSSEQEQARRKAEKDFACRQKIDQLDRWLSSVIADGTRAPAPPASAVDKEIREILGGDLSKEDQNARLAELTADICAECPNFKTVVNAIAKAGPASMYATSVPIRVTACSCELDIDNLKAALWAVITGSSPGKL